MKPIYLFLLAAAAAAQTYVNGGRTIEGPVNFCVDSGTTDSYACSLNPAITGYTAGAVYSFRANTANTGGATVNFNGLGARTIRKSRDQALADNDIKAGQLVTVMYDGAEMQMQSQTGNAAAGGGGGGGTVSAPYVLLNAAGSVANSVISGGAGNYGVCHRFGLQAGHAFSGLAVTVAVASGSCGGSCGFGVAVYNSSKSKVGQTSILTSGGSPDFNTAGAKLLTWASGSAVSGGTLTLAAGTYYACYSTDSTVAQFPMINVDSAATANGGNPGPHHGYQAAFTTGGGSGLTFPASMTGSFNTTSTGGQVIPMVFVP